MTATRVIDKHSELNNLDYASSGHTGFASTDALTTTSGDLQTNIDSKDNYSSWSFAVDGVTKDAITTGDVLGFVGGNNITITRSADDEITIAGAGGSGSGDVTAAANITDNRVIRGDGGAKGIQETTITVNDDGEMTNPNQPCFQVEPTTDQTNIPVAVNVTIVWGTERFDVGNNFASNRFTAPITGKYQLNVTLRVDDNNIANYYVIWFWTSNKDYYLYHVEKYVGNAVRVGYSLSQLVDMDQNDTCKVMIFQSNGPVMSDIKTTSYFSGALVC